jgi:Ser/Thr protein kinase RdoA (MazF antagonist)
MDHLTLDGVAENYALVIRHVDRLCEGEGCNYRLVDGQGSQYVLKIYPPSEEKLIAFITTLLAFLTHSDMRVQYPRPATNARGQAYTRQQEQILVLFHWIGGTTLQSVNPQIAQELGQAVSSLDRELHRFHTTHDRTYAECQDSLWSVTNIHRLDKSLQQVRMLLGEHYGLIQETVAQFDRTYPTLRNNLQKSLIHNDINPGNLLYDRRSNLTGIIDFMEICHTCRVCEVSVALAYLMQVAGDDCLRIGQSFVRGYERDYSLTALERQCLLLLTKLRLCITLIYNTMHLYQGRVLTEVQAQFIRNAGELLVKLSEITDEDFVTAMFP